MPHFSENLKKLMRSRAITARHLSTATGIPTSTLSEWTAGREPKLNKQMIKLAQFFGVSIEFLITGEVSEKTILKDVMNELKKDGFVTVHEGVYRVKIEKKSEHE